MGSFIDLTGQKFGRLTVLEKHGVGKHRQIEWLCRCDCGKEKVVAGYHMRNETLNEVIMLLKNAHGEHDHSLCIKYLKEGD